MPKLLLINPSNEHRGLGNIRSTAWPPLNLPYIAALTPSYYHIEIIDENVTPFKFKQADLVGVTAYTSSVNRAYQICKDYREHGIPTVMGGIHVSMMPHEAMRYCSVVVTGEAESVWPELIKDFEQGRLKRRYDGGQLDLSNLPLPRRDLLPKHHYLWGSLQTSRGCPMNCAFCSVTAFNGRRYRRRPLEAVIEELEQIPQRLVMIADDNLVGYGRTDREWASEFFKTILRRKIKKYFFVQASLQIGEDKELLKLAAAAGVRILFVGMESINPATLAGYNKSVNLQQIEQGQYQVLIKNIRRSGIACLGAFMIGGDHEDARVFDDTLKFIQSACIDILQLTKPTPLPGTRLWQQLQSAGRILNQNFPAAWDDYRLTKLVFEPAHMSREEVYAGSTYLRCQFYSPVETFKRTLKTFLTTRSPSATLLAFMINRSYMKAFRESDHYRRYNHYDMFRRFENA
ncbi:MAG: radical SAM protein [Desulfobacteraceae bacterium]|nr:radical SAM protein [Desulfobacteraceae bacterium]